MDTLQHILAGFSVALQPINLWYTFIGCLMGTVIGVLPGIGPAAGIALLIPVTFGMNPTSALIMMAGIYYGAMYGGSTTSILINTPGEASSVMTALDGYQMAKKGRAGAALAVAAIGSFIAGTISVVLLSVFALPMAALALKFGPAEYFTLMVFAMTAVAALTGASVAKGILSMILGLMIATIGIDLQSGQPRYTMGIPELQDGVGFIVAVVGLFAIGEVLDAMESYFKGTSEVIRIKGKLWLTREEWRRSFWPIIRGALVGFFKGVLPGAGATISTILSYSLERMIHPEKEKFGTGMIEGVAGPEAANNASTAGAMVPLLTLGVPGSGATAVLMGAFIMYGIQPGPLLFQNDPALVWGLIDSMYIGNVILVILNLPLIGLFVRLLYIPTGMMLPLILAISTIGVYSINGNTLELYIALLFGVAGYVFRKIDIPLAPMVLALVLGGHMEQSFRQAMTISGANPKIFVSSGISVTLLVLTAAALLLPILLPAMSRWKAGREDEQV
ncbi:MAG: tripartite tricarboxylate transporter permease [Burkholderiales bacterium]|nr:tripartite tricarboxylate transporter permease [Burkholderiales bacterium]